MPPTEPSASSNLLVESKPPVDTGNGKLIRAQAVLDALASSNDSLG